MLNASIIRYTSEGRGVIARLMPELDGVDFPSRWGGSLCPPTLAGIPVDLGLLGRFVEMASGTRFGATAGWALSFGLDPQPRGELRRHLKRLSRVRADGPAIKQAYEASDVAVTAAMAYAEQACGPLLWAAMAFRGELETLFVFQETTADWYFPLDVHQRVRSIYDDQIVTGLRRHGLLAPEQAMQEGHRRA